MRRTLELTFLFAVLATATTACSSSDPRQLHRQRPRPAGWRPFPKVSRRR